MDAFHGSPVQSIANEVAVRDAVHAIQANAVKPQVFRKLRPVNAKRMASNGAAACERRTGGGYRRGTVGNTMMGEDPPSGKLEALAIVSRRRSRSRSQEAAWESSQWLNLTGWARCK